MPGSIKLSLYRSDAPSSSPCSSPSPSLWRSSLALELARQVRTDVSEVIKLFRSWSGPLMLTIGCGTWRSSVNVRLDGLHGPALPTGNQTLWVSDGLCCKTNIPGTKPVGVQYDQISLRWENPRARGFQSGISRQPVGGLCTLRTVGDPSKI